MVKMNAFIDFVLALMPMPTQAFCGKVAEFF
jgi:hypothetical protein